MPPVTNFMSKMDVFNNFVDFLNIRPIVMPPILRPGDLSDRVCLAALIAAPCLIWTRSVRLANSQVTFTENAVEWTQLIRSSEIPNAPSEE